MSDRDSFIEEVSEEVRRDRMFSLWKRYGPFVIGGIVAVVALTGVKNWLDSEAEKAARQAGGALIAAGDATATEAAAALKSLAEQTDHDGASLLARLRAAGALAASGDADGASATYDEIAADPGADKLLQDFAAYRALSLRADEMTPDAAVDAFEPIANGAGPFRLLALEAQAAAHLRAGDRGAASEALQLVAEDESAPNGLRQRAYAALEALGVTIEPDAPETTESEG